MPRSLQSRSQHAQEHPTPVIWDIAPFLPDVMDTGILEYYRSTEVKLAVQTGFRKRFPDALLYPGLWSDFGTVVLPSAFGCRITWAENDAPYAAPCLNSLGDVDSLKPPRSGRDGLMPAVLDEYRHMWANAERDLIDNYGYLDGTAYAMGPLETAALIAGYEHLFIGMYEDPNRVKRLLEIITAAIVEWIHTQETVNGPAKRIFLADHAPTQISREFFLDFGLPSFQAIFDEFPHARRLWHNEGTVMHIADCLDRIGCDIFHCGDDIPSLMKACRSVTMMGNLPPLELMLYGTPDQVAARTRALIDSVADTSRLLVSTAGGMAPGTPLSNVEAMVLTCAERR